MSRSPHVRVLAVLSVPAASRFMVVCRRLSWWKWLSVTPASCGRQKVG